ncbi:RNA-directed DNA polymerase [Balamuthia mandrillaris]
MYIKDIHPQWNQDCQDAFDTLKHILSNSPVLSLYDPSLPRLVGTNAFQFSVGTILYQIRLNNKH